MICVVLLAALLQFTDAAGTTHHAANTPLPKVSTAQKAQLKTILKDLQDDLKDFKKTVGGLARQVMLQQTFVEERIRSEGNSGVKQIRVGSDGTRPWHYNVMNGGSVAAIHDHANYDRTVGMGELEVVLNGVDFRTRHNDYKLKMPSTTSKDYNKVEDVPFPGIPSSVGSKSTMTEKIQEMREYFKAFHTQNITHRNYKPYFKPVLCYLEGGWTTNTKTLDEPFESDRHFIDASSWMDLQEKVRFTSATGGKSQNENYSYLPTTVLNVTEDGEPIYGQWNYRIMCHPIKRDLDLSDFKLIDDLNVRMRSRADMTRLGKSRNARFSLDPRGRGQNYSSNLEYGTFSDTHFTSGLIDEIMMEVPGKDNYPGHITSNSFGLNKYEINSQNLTPINAARYHRWEKTLRPTIINHLGFSDENLYVAHTESPRIAKVTANDCKKNHNDKEVCHKYESRTTFAIPLEIIWLTPLNAWNPYDLKINDNHNKHYVTDHHRRGQLNTTLAYNGTSGFSYYYITPAEFFHGGEVNKDRADTAKHQVGVIDTHGQLKKMTASGIRVFLPDIPGVGKVRTRYPIMPAHFEGSGEFKHLSALQDVVMDMEKHTHMFTERPDLKGPNAHHADYRFYLPTTHKIGTPVHNHEVYVTYEDMEVMQKSINGTTVTVYSTEVEGHRHQLELQVQYPFPHTVWNIRILSCDGFKYCPDGHGPYVTFKPM